MKNALFFSLLGTLGIGRCELIGPVTVSSACGNYNCFDNAHIDGDDITCLSGISEAACAALCCSQGDACYGFDYSAQSQRCCTSSVSRANGRFAANRDHDYRSCEKNTKSPASPPSPPASPLPPHHPPSPPRQPPPPREEEEELSEETFVLCIVGGFVCGFLWCSSFMLCVKCKEMPEAVQRRFRRRCEVFAPFLLLGLIVGFNLFLWWEEFKFAVMGTGAAGDVAGVLFGLFLFTQIQKRCAGRAGETAVAVPPPSAPQDQPQQQPSPAEPHVAHATVVAASPEAGLPDVHVVVVGEPMPVVGGARVAGPSLDEPPVIDIVRVLKHELGLERGEENLLATVDAACSELGIAMEGTLRERADACWRALNCPAASTVERRPSCGPVA